MTTARTLRLVLFLSMLGTFPAVLWSEAPDSPLEQALSLQEYISTLDRFSAALTGNDPATVHNLRITLPKEWVVQDEGQQYRIDASWLAAALNAKEGKLHTDDSVVRHATQRLAELRAAAEAAAPSVQKRDSKQARARLDHILSASEFQGAHGPSWFDILKARIYSWIFRLLDRIFGRVSRSGVTGNTIAWTMVTLAALLLAFWAVRFFLRTGARPEMDLRNASALGGDWREWLRRARSAAERGDYRAAIHAAYWAGVARLEETRLLPEDRSRTPRESLKLIKQESAAYAPLAQLTRRFELVWYGYRSANSADWNDAMQQLETLGCQRSSTPATAGF